MPPFAPRPKPPWLYNATVIQFDRIPDGTVVNTHYSGVVFASVKVATFPTGSTLTFVVGDAYARNSPSAESPSNVISVIPPPQSAGFDIRVGAVQATFASPQQYVSIDALPVWSSDATIHPVNAPYIQAFGQDGHIMYTAFADPTSLSWQPLIVSSPLPDIYKVVFSCQHQHPGSVYAIFDRLVFSDRLPLILPVIAE